MKLPTSPKYLSPGTRTALITALLLPCAAFAQSGTWNSDSDGTWSDTSKWNGGIVADGADADASFIANFTAARTVTLDTPRTIGRIIYNDSGANPDIESLTITGPNTLTLANSSGQAPIYITGTNQLVLDIVLGGTDGVSFGNGSDGNNSIIYLNKQSVFTDTTPEGTSGYTARIQRGNLVLGVDNALPPDTVLNLNSGNTGLLILNGRTQTLRGLVREGGSGTRQVRDTVGGTLILNPQAGDYYDFSGTLGTAANGPNFGVVKAGEGTHRLSTTGNAYDGETLITNGVLEASAAGALGSTSGGTTVGGTGTLALYANITETTLTLSGSGYNGMGALMTAGAARTLVASSVTLAGNTTIATDESLSFTFVYISESVAGSGLTKIGTNALILAGSHAYTGPTVIADGWLVVPDSGTLGLAGSLTLTNALDLDYGDVFNVNPPSAKIYDASFVNGGVPLTVNGEVTINVNGLNFVAGAVPLIDYSGTIGGSGFAGLKLGNTPPGAAGVTLSNDTVNTIIYLNIPAVVDQLTWLGGVNSDWDISGTANWTTNLFSFPLASNIYDEISTPGGPVGDIVTFDDNFGTYGNPSATNINLTATVSPAIIKFTGFTYDFTLEGSGKLSGNTILQKEGLVTATINTANDFSGGSTLTSGILAAGNDAALGTGVVNLNGGTLAPAGGDRTLANDIILAATSTLAVSNGNLTLAGAVSSTGNRDLFIVGGGDVILTGSLNNAGAGGIDIQASRFIVDGASATNVDDGIRLYAQGGVAELILTNDALYEVGAVSGNPNIRLGQVADEAGTNFLRIDSGLFRMLTTAQSILVGDKNNTTGIVYQAGGTIQWQSDNSSTGVRFGTGTNAYGEYHLDGGTLEMPRMWVNPDCSGTLFWNGGTIKVSTNASADQFMTDVNVLIEGGGALLDTAGYDVTVAAPLGGTGGLTKQGAGAVTLLGTNTYPGATVVDAGFLVVGAAHQAPAAISVADGAGLGFVSTAPGETARIPSATLGSTSGARLGAGFTGQVGIPAGPAGHVTNLTLIGSVAVDVRSLPGAVVGTVPLIAYTPPILGGGSVTTGLLPQGVQGYVADNTGNNTLELVVTNVIPLVWVGSLTNDVWDVNTTTNWSLSGSPKTYKDFDNVVFDDSAAINTTHMLGVLSPGSVTVSNSAAPFSIFRTGTADYLAGAMGLTKLGTNVLLIGGANTFSGVINVLEGTLRPTLAGALGSIDGGTVIADGAALDVNGLVNGFEPVSVQGSGPDGQGAIVNGGASQQNALRDITLTGDVTWGGIGRWDLRGETGTTNATLRTGGQPFKITKIGDNVISINKALVDPALGDIDVLAGQFARERAGDGDGLGDPSSKVTVFSNALFSVYSLEIPLNKKVVVKEGGTFFFNSQADGVSSTNLGEVTLESGQCFVENRNGGGFTWTLEGPIVGAGILVKGGAGLMTLSAANTYTGGTVISNGTLALGVGGSIAMSPSIFVESNATFDVTAVAPWILAAGKALSGNGTLTGDVTVNGTVAPGASIGTLTFNDSLTLAGEVVVELDKDQAQSNDVVQVTLGTLTYGGALSVTNVGATPLVAGDQFTLFSAPSAVGDFTSITPSEPGNGLAWDFNPASGVLSVVGAAAPALTWTNLGGGVLEFTFDATSKLVWQTNALSVGLRDNWVDYPGGDTSPVSVTNDPAIPATFFGLQPK